ncbi:hypothetical protein GCK72_018505 [Caenorhabditis remanei]|uniref:Uncharacterized protein n=1 Tax=Caenorhabditis remanei TaxID=31234 RepID=A0A6A5GAY8_CAERE|nr:hypothetical protein GCK72_018505 [Caenorhabditis remanei]KAF1751951.1 hypothetical protein GCK72_018505 [Caenorhabditis remanei]
MGNLKDDLKLAAGLLKSGDNEKVIELLKDYTEEESADYRVFCFIALAYSNISNYDESYEMYKKAVEVDEANLMAWKGLFKLFEVESCTTPDQFSLRVCEFMQKNGDEKKVQASQALRRIHVELKLWTEIQTKFDSLEFKTDAVNLRQIIESLCSHTDKAANMDLLERAFGALKELNMLENDSGAMLNYCKFTKREEDITRLINQHKNIIVDEWVQKKMFETCCQKFFESKRFPEFVDNVTCAALSTMTVVNALKHNNIAAALDALDSVPDHSAYPDCLLFVELLAETENWEAVEVLARSINRIYSSPICNGWICRSLLEIEPDSIEKLQALGPLPLPEFAIEELKIAILSENENQISKLLNQYDESSNVGVVLRLTKALFSSENVTSEHVKLSERLSTDNSKDLVLAAEVRIRAGLDANSILVNAAKLNVRCSRAFYLLGNVIAVKNATKAKSLIERAVQIRPGSEEYTKSLHDLLVRKGVSPEERLTVLKTLLAKKRNRRKPFWISDALSLIYMDMDSLTEAIDELQQMVRLYRDNRTVWARLADAYTRKGHLRAAVSSYAQLAEMEDGHEYIIPITRVLLQLGECDEALDKIMEFRRKLEEESLECGSESLIVLDFTEAEIRLNLHETTCGEQKRFHLKNAFRLLTRCINADGNCSYAAVLKLFGDALLVVSKYAERNILYFEIDQKWQISTRLDCVTKAVSFYMSVLRSQKHDPLAWYDVSVGLLSKFKIENDQKILSKVQKILEHALSLTNVETLLSSIWALLAETKRLSEDPIRHRLHCLGRALELNKANDAAWLQLSVLCLEVGRLVDASRVLEQCIKYNPHNAEAWCAWAQTAHFQNNAHEALAMFRQALFVRAIPSAIVGYSTYLCDSLKKNQHRFDSATAALNFESIVDLSNLAYADENMLYHLGLLADLFGWYPEAQFCFELSQSSKITDELQHSRVKADILYNRNQSEPASHSDSRICGILKLTSAECYAFLTAEMDVYRDLYRFVETNDAEAFNKLYTSCVKGKGISVSLFISGLIMSNTNLPVEFIRTMHEALPRHELIDYYPTRLPEGMDNGLQHLEQDGEEPFRYRHRSAHLLLEELKILREKVEQENEKPGDESLPDDEADLRN